MATETPDPRLPSQPKLVAYSFRLPTLELVCDLSNDAIFYDLE